MYLCPTVLSFILYYYLRSLLFIRMLVVLSVSAFANVHIYVSCLFMLLGWWFVLFRAFVVVVVVVGVGVVGGGGGCGGSGGGGGGIQFFFFVFWFAGSEGRSRFFCQERLVFRRVGMFVGFLG